MTDNLHNVISILRNLTKLKNILLYISIIFSVGLYHYFVDYYYPEENIFQHISRIKPKYTIYSGKEPGVYIKIGDCLDKDIYNESEKFIIKNVHTNGAFENAYKTMNSMRAFGLIQEATIAKDDYIKERIRYISPLYLERMHVFYNKKLFKNSIAKENSLQSLIIGTSKSVQSFFNNTTVSTGPVGSGTNIFASYIIAQAGYTPQSILHEHTDLAIEKLKNNELGVVFSSVGAPIQEYIDLLNLSNGEKIGLFSISPSLVTDINKTYNINLRHADFKEKYSNHEDVTTLGSLTYLIASNDVPPKVINRFLKKLEKIRDQLNVNNSKFEHKHSINPLYEFDFIASYNKQRKSDFANIIRDILLFIVSVIISSFGLFWIFLWIISSKKTAKHFSELNYIIANYFPKSKGIEIGNYKVAVPIVDNSYIKIINDLAEGIHKTRVLTYTVREDYDTGGITDFHYNYINESLKDAISESKSMLAKNLEVSFLFSSDSISKDVIEKYYIGGYITKEVFEKIYNRS